MFSITGKLLIIIASEKQNLKEKVLFSFSYFKITKNLLMKTSGWVHNKISEDTNIVVTTLSTYNNSHYKKHHTRTSKLDQMLRTTSMYFFFTIL